MADLTDELRALGRAARPDLDADLFAARVVSALPGPATPATPAGLARPRPRLRRRVALAALAVLLALVATPPVRATIADWFGFGGVRVEPHEQPAPDGDDTGPPVLDPVASVAAAAARVDFPLLLPEVLGEPDGVEVSADRRLVSMTWARDGGTVRVDQFDGTVDYTLVKQAPRLRFVTVDGSDALWFPEPHRLAMLDTDGEPAGTARIAGRTLVWPGHTTTFRVEGADLSLERALEVAGSAEPVG